MSRTLVWGAALWSLRPVYILVELMVAAAATGGYHLLDDTVSELGATRCEPVSCSPRHELMNGTFVLTGLLLAVGAVLLVAWLGRGVVVLLVVAERLALWPVLVALAAAAATIIRCGSHPPTLNAVAGIGRRCRW